MLNEIGSFGDSAIATLNTSATGAENMGIHGYYHVLGHDKDGNLMWEENFPNLVNAVGKQLMLDTLLRTSGTYTTVGPFLGLLNSGGTFLAADTFASHAGWTEFTSYTVGGSGVRGTAAFAASSSSGLSPSNVTTSTATAITYAITGTGTVGGCFLLTGTGATNAFSNTTLGTLYSAGNFTSAKAVSAGDTLTVTYSTTATS